MKFGRAIPWIVVAGGLAGLLVWASGGSRPRETQNAVCVSQGDSCQLGANKRGVCSAGPSGLTCMDQH